VLGSADRDLVHAEPYGVQVNGFRPDRGRPWLFQRRTDADSAAGPTPLSMEAGVSREQERLLREGLAAQEARKRAGERARAGAAGNVGLGGATS
jgi:hypothetical protein